jgi:DNA-binding GntR family transcriptional regulator
MQAHKIQQQRADASATDKRVRLTGAVDLNSERSIRYQVYSLIREAILDVLVAPGEMIPENELAIELGVSRTPIRETLQRLSSEGLVRVVPQVGTFVAGMDLARIQEALFVRETIECAAVARIPRKLKKAEVHGLEEIVARYRAAAQAGNSRATLASDEDFHRRLLELAGLPGTWRYVLHAREMHRRLRVLARPEGDAGKKSVAQHAAIVRELAAGRPSRAALVLREHIRMNARVAEAIASRYPSYFDGSGRHNQSQRQNSYRSKSGGMATDAAMISSTAPGVRSVAESRVPEQGSVEA